MYKLLLIIGIVSVSIFGCAQSLTTSNCIEKLGSHCEERDYDQIAKEYESIINAEPTNIEAYYKLSLIYFHKMSQTEEALKVLEKAKQIEPEHPKVRFAIGRIYEKTGRTEEAIIEYKIAIKSNHPGIWTAHHNLGIIYGKKREYEKAVSYQKKVIEMNPRFGGAYYSLGCYAAQNKQFEAALDYLKTAFCLSPWLVKWSKEDEDLDPLREHKEYKKLMMDVQAKDNRCLIN